MASSTIRDNYILARDPSASCRLNAQHYLWFDGAPIFDDKIPTDKENIRVAEIGVGTAIWLIHASRQLPKSAQLDGFDISFAAAPSPKWLPKNVTLHVKDMLQPSPDDDEFAGKYDIVHIQHFVTIIRSNDPVPVFRNLFKLLKPGGRIIWAEWDYRIWHDVYASGVSRPNDLHKQLFEYAHTLGNTRPEGIHGGWPARLPEIFVKEGLINVSLENRVFPPELMLPAMDTTLTAREEMALVALDKLDGGQGDQMREYIAKIVKRRREVGFNYGRLTAVGQKPE